MGVIWLVVFVFFEELYFKLKIMNREDEKYLRFTEVSAAIGWVVAIILATVLIAQ